VLIAAVTLESVVLTIVGLFRKVEGAKIVGFGLLFFGIFFLFIAIVSIVNDGINVDESTFIGMTMELLAMGAIVSLPISMSAYLAWSFSTMNKGLKNQLEQIKELSDKTIKQEQQQKEQLEQQNLELEKKVIERTYEVQHQKELIEIKNKAITDNLIYAQRIQSAILPDINLIHKTLGQSFILYLPKDIVSGDFYSFNKQGSNILIAAGDCTGHGVSGAFMSMIGSSLLNQIINEKGIAQPAEILTSLNTAVIETLKQNQNESTDGMDIALCSFNLAENELQYAGANRPIYLVRGNTLDIIKPDKLPIGGLQVASDRTFTNNTVKLQAGDTIYLFTDGFTDQFGGEKGKKLMAARFKEELLSIQHQGMQEQLAHLNAYFEGWKGDNEQVDDVLVIGIRV
jgi:serine phosphatase RsbU (regulator of sigma subunit)